MLDGRETKPLSRASDFFRAYKRIKFGTTDLREFSMHKDYMTGISFQALPYLLLGVLLVLAAVVWNTYRYFRRGLSPGADDTKDSDPDKRDMTAKTYILFSSFLHVSIFLLIAVTANSNAVVRAAVDNAHWSIGSLISDLQNNVVEPAKLLAARTEKVSKIFKDLGLVADDSPRSTAYTMLSTHENSFLETQASTEDIIERLRKLDKYLNDLSIGMYYGISVILLVFVLGCFLMYFSDVAPPRAHKVRMLMIVFFAVPLGASWSLVGVSTIVGQAAGDFCHSIHHFHYVVAIQGTSNNQGPQKIPRDNIFFRYHLQCPKQTKFGKDLNFFHRFYRMAENSEKFHKGMAIFDNSTKPEAWAELAQWGNKYMEEYKSCKSHMSFAGTVAYNICGDQEESAVSAMALLWLSSVGLSMLFGVLVFISSLGQPPSEYATGYEMLHLYGAPKLIRAFGGDDDSANFRRLSTYHDLEGGKHKSDVIRTLHVTKSVAEAFTDCAIEVEDDYLVKIASNPNVGKSPRKRSSMSSVGTLLRRSSIKATELDEVAKIKAKNEKKNNRQHSNTLLDNWRRSRAGPSRAGPSRAGPSTSNPGTASTAGSSTGSTTHIPPAPPAPIGGTISPRSSTAGPSTNPQPNHPTDPSNSSR